MKRFRQIWVLLTLALLVLLPSNAMATYVAPSGAVDLNAEWEAGNSPQWFVEFQAYGAILIDNGLARHDDALIRKGMRVFDWAFAHQAADGSFLGTGDPFHSVSVFSEAAARATLQLQQHDPTAYAAKIGFYATRLESAARWMLLPAVASRGQSNDQPYAHRAWLLAAVLGQIGTLTNNSQITQAALPYVQRGLARQLLSGTLAVTYPDGSVRVVDLTGVNPELGGFDVSYQCVGVMHAARYYALCSDPVLKAQIETMIVRALLWEMTRIDVKGVIDVTGSTRTGRITGHGTGIKQPNIREMLSAFRLSYAITGEESYQIVIRRIEGATQPPTTLLPSASGAVGINARWEAGQSSYWSLKDQRYGADWIQRGIEREDSELIERGMRILGWGFARQAASGDFTGSGDRYNGTAIFVEAASRALRMLNGYQPVIDLLLLENFRGQIVLYTQQVHLAVTRMLLPSVSLQYQQWASASTSSRWLIAGALSGAAILTANGDFGFAADSYARRALLMQGLDGQNPENGRGSVNLQAQGLVTAARYSLDCADPVLAEQVRRMLEQGLFWEMGFVDVNGNVTTNDGTAPWYATIKGAFRWGTALTEEPVFAIVVARIDAHH